MALPGMPAQTKRCFGLQTACKVGCHMPRVTFLKWSLPAPSHLLVSDLGRLPLAVPNLGLHHARHPLEGQLNTPTAGGRAQGAR
jgi:hypothetical protein